MTSRVVALEKAFEKSANNSSFLSCALGLTQALLMQGGIPYPVMVHPLLLPLSSPLAQHSPPLHISSSPLSYLIQGVEGGKMKAVRQTEVGTLQSLLPEGNEAEEEMRKRDGGT